MVGNNSAGTRSIVYGLTKDRLDWADVVLSDGTTLHGGQRIRDFNGDPNVIGRIVQLSDRPTEIIGVMPASFASFAYFSCSAVRNFSNASGGSRPTTPAPRAS